MNDNEIITRKTIEDVYAIKCEIKKQWELLTSTDKRVDDLLHSINNYSFWRLEKQSLVEVDKIIDQKCWSYFVQIYQLEKYMLCTEYAKLEKEIDAFIFPEFTVENAKAWLASLKNLVYKSIQQLIEDVFNRITQKTYYTGSGYSSRIEKKRNNKGIDKIFIITTYDYSRVFGYQDRPTITDDLEKACYIIDGKVLPEKNIITQLRANRISEGENAYFKIRVCKNGNTHYWLNDDIRNKLNFYGAKRGFIGENVKIKIFEK